MEALLLGTERVLAVAATGNVALDDLGALAGIDPIPRDATGTSSTTAGSSSARSTGYCKQPCPGRPEPS